MRVCLAEHEGTVRRKEEEKEPTPVLARAVLTPHGFEFSVNVIICRRSTVPVAAPFKLLSQLVSHF